MNHFPRNLEPWNLGALELGKIETLCILMHSIFPGCVYIKAALSEQEQVELATYSKAWEPKLLPTTKTRNRVYDAISNFPNADHLLTLCKRLLTAANGVDKQIIVDTPTHLLFLQYFTNRGMGFHRDNGENDGSALNPVVSISLGNSCTFAVKHPKTGVRSDIELQSGDVIIFGGDSRFMQHAVESVKSDCPAYLVPLIGKVRLNYTMRYAPEILGRESEFETFDAYANSTHAPH
jgi:alkylated DNA repair dioxygenase AlkB